MVDETFFTYTLVGATAGGCGHRHRALDSAELCRADGRRNFLRAGLVYDRRLAELVPDQDPPTPRPTVGRTVWDRLLDEPFGEWATVCGCILTNRYHRADQLERFLLVELFERFPNPRAMAYSAGDLEELIGGHPDRARNLRRFSRWWEGSGYTYGEEVPLRPELLLASRAIDRYTRYTLNVYDLFVLETVPRDVDDQALRAVLYERHNLTEIPPKD